MNEVVTDVTIFCTIRQRIEVINKLLASSNTFNLQIADSVARSLWLHQADTTTTPSQCHRCTASQSADHQRWMSARRHFLQCSQMLHTQLLWDSSSAFQHLKPQQTELSVFQQEVKVIWQKAPHGGPIPQLGVTLGGRNLYHWIPGVGFPISVP